MPSSNRVRPLAADYAPKLQTPCLLLLREDNPSKDEGGDDDGGHGGYGEYGYGEYGGFDEPRQKIYANLRIKTQRAFEHLGLEMGACCEL